MNNLGKHLNKETGQDDPNNRCILDILDRIGSLAGTSTDPDKEQMARQATKFKGDIMPNLDFKLLQPALKIIIASTMTGVGEFADLSGTLNLMRALQPRMREIMVISDKTNPQRT